MSSLIDDLEEFADGKAYVLDGVAGHLKRSSFRGRSLLEHHVSAEGKRSARYKAVRKQLGDDYVSEIFDYDDVVRQLGFVWWDVVAKHRGLVIGKDRYSNRWFQLGRDGRPEHAERNLETVKKMIDAVYGPKR